MEPFCYLRCRSLKNKGKIICSSFHDSMKNILYLFSAPPIICSVFLINYVHFLNFQLKYSLIFKQNPFRRKILIGLFSFSFPAPHCIGICYSHMFLILYISIVSWIMQCIFSIYESLSSSEIWLPGKRSFHCIEGKTILS